jgi:hypothetical protein
MREAAGTDSSCPVDQRDVERNLREGVRRPPPRMTMRDLSTDVIWPMPDGSVGQPCDRVQDSAENNVPEQRCHRFLGTSKEQSDTEDRHGDQAGQEPDRD